jgi:hypothetical protein
MLHIAVGVFAGIVGAVWFLNWLTQAQARRAERREQKSLEAVYAAMYPKAPPRASDWAEKGAALHRSWAEQGLDRAPHEEPYAFSWGALLPFCYYAGFGLLLWLSAMLVH